MGCNFFRWCKCIEDIEDDKDGTIARQIKKICSLEAFEDVKKVDKDVVSRVVCCCCNKPCYVDYFLKIPLSDV